MVRYIINTPQYRSNSAGIRVLYELNKHLILRGFDSIPIIVGSNFVAEHNDIIIYPEIVKGNPLKGKKVVRYILNEPGLIGGDKEFDESEIKFVYHEKLKKYSDNLLTVPCIEPFFKNDNKRRDKVLFYVGKGIHEQRIDKPEWLQVTKDWPKNREQLAHLLKTTHTFYTYDDFTMLIDEALYCGCSVYLIKNNTFIPIVNNYYDKMVQGFSTQLDNFIELTQKRSSIY